MTIAENTRSRNPGDVDGSAAVLQEILRKLDALNSRVGAMENGEHRGKDKLEQLEDDNESESRGKLMRRSDVYGDGFVRQARIEFPCFEGQRVQDWLFKCDKFFELDNTPAELRVSMASVHLSGLAMEWHHAFVKNRKLQGPFSWMEYTDAMMTRSIESKRPIAHLKRLKEEGNFFTYVDAFVSLVSQVELSDEDQVALFIEGLKRDNKKFIIVLSPNNLQQAISYAKTLTADEDPYIEQKRYNEQGASVVRPVPWSSVKQGGIGGPVRSWNNATRVPVLARVPAITQGRVNTYLPLHRRISNAEMDERRAKGLCFWCDEMFTFNHKCADSKKLYSLVLEDPVEEEEVIEAEVQEVSEEYAENVATLTLHALHGIDMTWENQMMKIVGQFKKKKINVLIDSGSTHNFLDLTVARQIGCVIQKIEMQKVMVANGEKMGCNAKVNKFTWYMQGHKFEADMLLMPLPGCELILGKEWLNAMGVIRWDFLIGQWSFIGRVRK